MNNVPNPNIDIIMENALLAAQGLKKLSQSQIDAVVESVTQAGYANRVELAQAAHRETGLGKWRDKVIKNIIATQLVYRHLKNEKTVGIISEDPETGIIEIAQPMGPIFAVTPITNPTSTTLFKILIALKSRNPLILRPHGSARKCSALAAEICYQAALKAGAPPHCIQWITRSGRQHTLDMMAHKKTALLLATGSVSLVRAAYSSGNPAIGVGPGNVAAYIDEDADIITAMEHIFLSKTFDNGTICASEQALVILKQHREIVMEQFQQRKAHILSPTEIKQVEAVAFNKELKVMKTEVIGQPATVIAALAGIDVPADTSLLVAPLEEVGMTAPLSFEILAPILAFYVVDTFKEAIARCRQINAYGGLGHTACIFSKNHDRIRYFASSMNATRILVNTPASQGALGGMYNFLPPSLTLGCGTAGKTSHSDNITAKHLLNIQRITLPRNNTFHQFDIDAPFNS